MSALWGSHGPRVRAHRNWHRFENMFGYELTRLARVWRIARAVESGVPADAFTDAHLRAGMEDVSGVLGNTASLLREIDLLTLLECEYDLMAEGLRLTYLPAEELPVLGAHGIEMTRADLERSGYRVSRTARATQYREVTHRGRFLRPRGRWTRLPGRTSRMSRKSASTSGCLPGRTDSRPVSGSSRRSGSSPASSRVWARLSRRGDDRCRCGGLPWVLSLFPCLPKSSRGGALASLTAGVGTVMSGVGDLRAE